MDRYLWYGRAEGKVADGINIPSGAVVVDGYYNRYWGCGVRALDDFSALAATMSE